MFKIIKNTLLNYIPDNFVVEAESINPARIFDIYNKPIKTGNVLYLCEREIRVKDNFALQFAIQKSKELNVLLKIIYPKINYSYEPKQKFIDEQIEQAQVLFQKLNLNFEIANKTSSEIIKM